MGVILKLKRKEQSAAVVKEREKDDSKPPAEITDAKPAVAV